MPQTAILDATDVQVRRPAAHRPGRSRFVSGKRQRHGLRHTVKALVLTDARGRLLFVGETRPGRCHDLTQVRQSGLVELVADRTDLELLADKGYQGLAKQTGFAVRTPMPTRARTRYPIRPETAAVHEQARHAHSSARIRVARGAAEHGIAHLKNWRALSRHLGRREALDETFRAAAGLASSQQRAARSQRLPGERLALPAVCAA